MQITALLVGLTIIFPIIYGILGAFKSPAEFSAYPPSFWPKSFAYTQNFQDAFARVPFLRYGLNSLIVALIGTTARLLFAVLAAFAFAFYDFRFKKTLFLVILATMMLPGDTLLVTNYLTVSRLGLLNSYLGMAITSFVGATQMFMLRQSFLTFPRDLKEAGQIDGCGDLRFLATILLPISKPVLVTLSVQSFVTLWNAYLWPLLVTNSTNMRTIQVGITMITSFEDTNYHLVLAGVTLSLIPAFLLFIVLRRNIHRNMTAGALVG
ncbi:MAG: carbohydrate ABC transporter permease [Clostridiales bacterium]|nr:carbohydrate ABC transporter permease [Clostridiales bacterium]